ncbi:putative uncharacterized protein DDB_G0281733 isoform X2 [Argiope bruennichi]|uniref:putative uncharacterized protein DDB_G0281733 isoform X2 n=1 Tax=Argiope bruennichi TaxID=94029 RepID=UPI0024949E25|nr:putative uncharacterized protein DDB_G0281733 isoform X2 [Argiope bruennichi]
MDLQGDEELEALRLAALATLKTHPSKRRDSGSFAPENISKVSTLITSKSADQQTYSMKDMCDQSQGSVYGNQQSWRNSQPSRRGRGRQFPKGNQRSNLIVITPVNLCKKTDEKETPSHLVLPQHKWCQSVNEDSSSPKSYRRIGPTRFNRHGSDSESSEDSDYDNSDNDSYSNDTVLQDEPSEPFSTFTPEENTEDERLVEKQQTTPDRRLSFHNIDSQDKKAENVHNSRKDAYLNSSKEETKTFKAVSKEKLEREFSDNYHNISSTGDEHVSKIRSHSPIQFQRSQSNGGSNSKKDNLSRNYMTLEKDNYKYSRKQSEKRIETDSHHNFTMNDSRNHMKNLSEGDLRYELKKRMQEKPFKTIGSRIQNDSFDNHYSIEQNRNHIHLRRSDSSEDSDHAYKHKSRDYRFRDHKTEAQSHSSSENDHNTSPIRNHVSHNRFQTDVRTNLNRKRERSHSSERSYKRSRSQSLERRSEIQIRRRRRHSGRSSSSTSSSSSSSKSSISSPRLRLVSSVVKPVARTDESKIRSNDTVSEKRSLSLTESSSHAILKRQRNSDEKPKALSSMVKNSVSGCEKHINTSDAVKRVPVHMRLGTLPHKRVIRMTKDVEAAFISTSSDEDADVNTKYKKQNYRVVTELSGNKLDEVSKRHVEKSTCRNLDVFKGRRMKIER